MSLIGNIVGGGGNAAPRPPQGQSGGQPPDDAGQTTDPPRDDGPVDETSGSDGGNETGSTGSDGGTNAGGQGSAGQGSGSQGSGGDGGTSQAGGSGASGGTEGSGQGAGGSAGTGNGSGTNDPNREQVIPFVARPAVPPAFVERVEEEAEAVRAALGPAEGSSTSDAAAAAERLDAAFAPDTASLDRARSFAEAAQDRESTAALIAAITPAPDSAPSLARDSESVRGLYAEQAEDAEARVVA